MYYSSSSSLQVPRLLATCDEVATKTFREDLYRPYTPVLGQLTCSCDDVKVAPRVTVPATTAKSCSDVCVSWKKTCEPKRAWEIGFDPSGGIAFYKTGNAVALGCSELPAAKSGGSALDMYLCACR